jgi:Heterokaryon incompatibility protein (HET)
MPDTLEVLPIIRFGSAVPEKPEDGLETILGWIKNCETSHQNCTIASYRKLPRRVIDVQAWRRPYLYESKGEGARYVALSHRWGKSQLLKTTTLTLESRKRLINWPELSRTFQDAILFTARLGVRYLWIDSLCIIQDSKADWEEESSKMAPTYENAYVTIAANCAENVSSGLFAPRIAKSATIEISFPGRPDASVLVREPFKHGQFYEASTNVIRDSSYPLFERAWCFQERLLANRILHFTKNEVVFECRTTCNCECTIIGLRGEDFIKAYYQKLLAGKHYVDSWVGWRTVVTDYSKNRLTNRRDILPALAGIASQLQCAELGIYVAGLWEKELVHGLFWYTTVSAPVKDHIYTAPSFSWASLIGRADFQNLQWTDAYSGSKDIRGTEIKILEVSCSVNGRNAYGEVSSGFVKLEAVCHPAVVRHLPGKDRPEMTVFFKSNHHPDLDFEGRARVFMDSGRRQTEMIFEERLICFVGFWGTGLTIVGLVLEQISNDSYRRVGYFDGLRRPLFTDYARVKEIIMII